MLCCAQWLSHVQVHGTGYTPWTVTHQAPLSMGVLQARILEWASVPSSRESSPTPGSSPGILGAQTLEHKVRDKERQISRVTGMNEIRGKMSHGTRPGLEVNRRGVKPRCVQGGAVGEASDICVGPVCGHMNDQLHSWPWPSQDFS